LKKTHL